MYTHIVFELWAQHTMHYALFFFNHVCDDYFPSEAKFFTILNRTTPTVVKFTISNSIVIFIVPIGIQLFIILYMCY